MDERKLYEILGQDLEVPDMVNRKLQETYALAVQKQPTAKRRGFRPLRTVLIAAAAAALLCGTAAAAYDFYTRQNVAVNEPQTVQGIVGGGQPSWERKEVYNEYGKLDHYWPNRETVAVDPAQAQALLGDYLPESGYQWQIEDYTFTVEGYVLDEHTGTAKFYYTMEHPGGFGEGAVDWEHGWLNNQVYKPSVMFETMSDVDRPWISGRTYVDVERSTQEKVCVVESAASMGGWKAEDGLRIRFIISGDEHEEDGRHYSEDPIVDTYLDLPAVKSLPTRSATDPVTGNTVELSAIGLMLSCEDMDMVGYVAVDYADGARYVVWDRANNLDNSDHGLGSGDWPDMVMRYVFNRLVDPAQVTAVIVDSQRYEVG